MLHNICLFTGCSLTAGYGLDFERDDPGLWCNILHQTHPLLSNFEIVNAAISGSNNQEIFNCSIESLIKFKPKFMFVGWTESYRVKINPGLETYETSIFLSSNCEIDHGIVLNDCTYDINYLTNIKNRWFDLQNIHYMFVNLLNYCRILKKISDHLGTKIFFVNNVLEWDDLYFDHIDSSTRTPTELTKFTQDLLNVNSRDDMEIFKIYDRMHREYNQTQGLDNWLNIYQSFRNNFYLDTGNDNLHPGYQSQKKFAEFLLTRF